MAKTSPQTNEKRRMTANEAAEYLDAHPDTVRKWIRQGKIPARRIGRLGDWILYEHELRMILENGSQDGSTIQGDGK